MKLDGDSVVHELPLPEATFRFIASNIRQERTGIHARVGMYRNAVLLAFSNFNVERNEERTRLGNSAHKMLGKDKETYSVDSLRHDLDLFCDKLWNIYISGSAPSYLEGDSTLPLEYALNPHVMLGGGTIIFSPPGKGKSWTGIIMAVTADSGTNGIWGIEKKHKTLFVNLERSPLSIKRRIGQVNDALGLEPNRPLLVMNARGRNLQSILPGLERAVGEEGVEVIFIDSISRTGLGDLTENRDVNRIVDAANSIAPSWVALGHTPRADDSHIYGGIHFDAAADLMIRLVSQTKDDEMGVQLQVTKSNDAVIPKPMTLAYKFDSFGLQQIRTAKPSEFPEIASSQKTGPADEIYDYLTTEAGKADAGEIAQTLSMDRGNVSRILNSDPRFMRLPKEGKRVPFTTQER